MRNCLTVNQYRPKIKVVAKYGNLFKAKCFPEKLNSVFMNILANAIDSFDNLIKVLVLLKFKPISISLLPA